MFFNVLNAKDLIDFEDQKFHKKVLMESPSGSLTAIALKKEEIIDTHTSANDAAVFVIDGEIELHFDAEKFKIDKHQILMFKRDMQHKVVALKDSKFLLLKI